MAPCTPAPRRLARAAWALGLAAESGCKPPAELDVEGVRLVSEVATSWTRKYQFTIVQLGFDQKSSLHYECIFSRPTNEQPVPMTVLSIRFALVLPGDGRDPRLMHSFEEGDLRHEWKLVRDENGQWRALEGQQSGSLGHGRFEKYLDRLVHKKETVRERGIDLTTSFEATRLRKPPAHSEDDSDEGSTCESSRANTDGGMVVPHIATHMYMDADSATPAGAREDVALGMRQALQAADLWCETSRPPASLSELLANIFDAADEDSAGELPHYEVARLLSGTLPGFGLELWDIYLLMTSAQENDDGFIECKPFIQAAPEIVQALCKRRSSYRSRGLPGVDIPLEAAKHCFADEVHVTANQLFKVFEQCTQEEPSCGRWNEAEQTSPRSRASTFDHTPTNRRGCSKAVRRNSKMLQASDLDGAAEERMLVGIKRRFCQDCLAALPERLSPQEAMRLMQMLPEDEDGFIMINELAEHLEHLRTEAMLNALVESDVLSLRMHLVLRFRHLGLEDDGKMRLWVIKQALLQADQVCLTRLHIHVLLCLAKPDAWGNVDIATFLGTCSAVIPHMFDARLFVETAERLIQEHAEAMRHAENAEMAALGAAQKVGQMAQDEVEVVVVVDSDLVEKMLQQVISLNDDAHRNPPSLPPETIFDILQTNEKEVQSTQLSSFELNGFLAEMQPDSEGLVAYVDHIKKWVPLIFEQRKNRLLSRYLEENSAETLGFTVPDLEKLEAMFPLLVAQPANQRGARRKHSKTRMENSDEFADSRRLSISSNPPSYRISSKNNSSRDDSGLGSKANSKDRSGRRRSTLDPKDLERPKVAKVKEPPPGRGYARRKARMEATAAAGVPSPCSVGYPSPLLSPPPQVKP